MLPNSMPATRCACLTGVGAQGNLVLETKMVVEKLELSMSDLEREAYFGQSSLPRPLALHLALPRPAGEAAQAQTSWPVYSHLGYSLCRAGQDEGQRKLTVRKEAPFVLESRRFGTCKKH